MIEIEIAALNLTGLGLGYLALQNWKRWAIHFAGLLILIFAGSMAHASNQPTVWMVLFLLYFLWMAYDGWKQAGKNRDHIPSQLKSKPWVIPVLIFLIFVCEILGFSFYRTSAKNTYQVGMEKYESSNYPEAEFYFNRLTTIYELSLDPVVVTGSEKLAETRALVSAENVRKSQQFQAAIDSYNSYWKQYPKSTKKNEIDNAIASVYREWGLALQGQSNFVDALQKYTTALEKYPDVPVVEQFFEEMANLNLQIARQQVEKKDYSGAINTYKILANKYSYSVAKLKVPEEIADAYVKLAQVQQSNNDFENAASNLQLVLSDYPSSSAFNQAQLLLPKVLLGRAVNLREQRHYLDALVNFDQIKKMTTDQILLDSVQKEYDTTIQSLASDTGKDGTSIVLLAADTACADTKPEDSTISNTLELVVGIFKDEPAKAALCGEIPIPAEKLATSPGTLRFVVKRQDGEDRTQSCSYTHGHTLERMRRNTTLTVIDILTKKIVAKSKLLGSNPPACPANRSFYGTVDQSYGDTVSYEQMNSWLDKAIK